MADETAGLRRQARDFFQAGVRAADPADATARALEDNRAMLDGAGRVHVLAAGKAALAMADVALAHLPAARRGACIAVTNPENARPLPGCTVHAASHPLPDAAGVEAAAQVEAAARAAVGNELVLALISGGASALLPAPVDGLTLDDKIAVTDILLKSGANIGAINTVRKALSRLKGGGLARAAAPADVLGLILSDVPGDDPAAIASGPTVVSEAPLAADALAADALAVIEAHGLGAKMPAAAMRYLVAAAAKPPAGPPGNRVHNRIIGSNRISLHAVEAACRDAGWPTEIMSDWLDGDVGDAARRFIEAARGAGAEPLALLAGGETGVHVTGAGLGGRNQEMALRFAVGAGGGLGRPYAFLSGGTDGRDGPTDAAGGLVDHTTAQRAVQIGCDIDAHLADNDAYHGLQTLDDLLVTGATGTNVADLQILLLGRPFSADT